MHIGNMKLWLGLGVAGMVAATLVLFGVSLSNTPEVEATTGDFNRIIVEIEQADKEFKVDKAGPNTFTCQSTGEMVPALFKDLKVSKDDDPNNDQQIEIWSGDFTSCAVTDNEGEVGITISLVPASPVNTLVIKACHLQDVGLDGPVRKAECIAKSTGVNTWTAYFVAKVNDGNLAGVTDIVVGNLNANIGYFYCIVKTDHELPSNLITTHLQCNIDINNPAGQPPPGFTPPSWDDTCDSLAARVPPECVPGQLRNPSETGPNMIAGPPPPPPYTSLTPQVGRGEYFPNGADAHDYADNPVTCSTACSVVVSCFEDTGPFQGTGPNIIAKAVLLDPKNPVSVGVNTMKDMVKEMKVEGEYKRRLI